MLLVLEGSRSVAKASSTECSNLFAETYYIGSSVCSGSGLVTGGLFMGYVPKGSCSFLLVSNCAPKRTGFQSQNSHNSGLILLSLPK